MKHLLAICLLLAAAPARLGTHKTSPAPCGEGTVDVAYRLVSHRSEESGELWTGWEVGFQEYGRAAIPQDARGDLLLPDSVATEGGSPIPVRWISRGAFQGCAGLTSVRLPQSLLYVSDCAFQGCANLREVTLPDSVRWLFPKAFEGCDRLRRVRFLPMEPPKTYVGGTLAGRQRRTVTLVVEARTAARYLNSLLATEFPYHAEMLPAYREAEK